MTLASSTSVNVSVFIPLKSKSESIEYSRLALIYSNDPSMQDNHRVLIDIDEQSNQPNQPWKSTIKSASVDKDGAIDKDNKEPEEKTITRKVKITNLDSGKFYFFQLVPGFQDVDGPPTEPESIFVDGFPQPPPKPVSIVNSDNLSITILSELGATTGSAISSYRLYHSNDHSMKPSFLVDQILVTNMQLEDGKIKFIFSNPELRLSHYFHVTAVNIMGESVPSEVSDKSVIGNFF